MMVADAHDAVGAVAGIERADNAELCRGLWQTPYHLRELEEPLCGASGPEPLASRG